MTNMGKNISNADDIAPAVPMSTAAAFALARDDEESQKIATAFRQAIASP